ncbi:MAG: hypothetical protein ACFCUI_14175 [Bernardetiaceae bacterium]
MKALHIHTAWVSACLALLLFSISCSGVGLDLTVLPVATSTDAHTDTELSPAKGLKATLQQFPKFVFAAAYVIPPHALTAGGLLYAVQGGDRSFDRPSLLRQGVFQTRSQSYLACLLNAPNAP